jgi:hypothetical protein
MNGSVLWGWPLASSSDTGFVGNLVVTDNQVFLSTNQLTFAINRTTHQSEWSHGHQHMEARRIGRGIQQEAGR